MNIDERLEKLTERHEALTQSVELLTIENRHLAGNVEKLAGNIGKLDVLVREITGGIHGLVTIVQSHERRVSDLEHP